MTDNGLVPKPKCTLPSHAPNVRILPQDKPIVEGARGGGGGGGGGGGSPVLL